VVRILSYLGSVGFESIQTDVLSSFSVCAGAFWDRTLKQTATPSPHILPNSLFLMIFRSMFVDSPYYSESELCGGAVTVSFSKYLPWQAMQFLQPSIRFSKTWCRSMITSKFLASELPFHGRKSQEIAWGEIWTVWRMF
jgi:hypothetical protein